MMGYILLRWGGVVISLGTTPGQSCPLLGRGTHSSNSASSQSFVAGGYRLGLRWARARIVVVACASGGPAKAASRSRRSSYPTRMWSLREVLRHHLRVLQPIFVLLPLEVDIREGPSNRAHGYRQNRARRAWPLLSGCVAFAPPRVDTIGGLGLR